MANGGTSLTAEAMLPIAILVLCFASLRGADGCVLRRVGEERLVCVCDADSCDEPGVFQPPPEVQQLLKVVSSQDGLRFNASVEDFQEPGGSARVTLTVNRTRRFQTLFGFGGAMTDAAAINMASLSGAAREKLLRAYFSPEGLDYNLVRVPMAGTDFSTRPYSYDDLEGDTTLAAFDLAAEDYQLKMPLLRRAAALGARPLRLLSAAWSAPKWMKTNNEFYGNGKLKPEFYQLWADYHLKFFEKYSEAGLPLWATSAQNEPTDAELNATYNCMGWSAAGQRDWVKDFLAPTLSSLQTPPLILVMDDQRTHLDAWTAEVLEDESARRVVAGVALHWYADSASLPSSLDHVHDTFPDKFLLYTEACNGIQQFGQIPVDLGSWDRGEAYATDIIQVLNHWVTGWMDWNLALDESGGPNWARNNVDSPVIVNATADEFYKQPMFYVMGHFSKFLPEGSVRVHLDVEDTSAAPVNFLDAVAFLSPEGNTVVELLNRGPTPIGVLLKESAVGEYLFEVSPRSITTLLYK